MIAWWIKSGAKNETTIAELKPSAEIHTLIENELKLGRFSEKSIDVAELASDVVAELEQAGFHLSRIQKGQPFISVIYANIKEDFSEQKVTLLLMRNNMMAIAQQHSSRSQFHSFVELNKI